MQTPPLRDIIVQNYGMLSNIESCPQCHVTWPQVTRSNQDWINTPSWPRWWGPPDDILTRWGLQNIVAILQTTFSNAFSSRNCCILIQYSLNFVPSQVNIILHCCLVSFPFLRASEWNSYIDLRKWILRSAIILSRSLAVSMLCEILPWAHFTNLD